MILPLFGEVMKKHTNAKKCVVDYITFDSKQEAQDYRDLKMRWLAEEISEPVIHYPFPLIINGIQVGIYEADFVYHDKLLHKDVVQETKGRMMRGNALKYKVFCALYPDFLFKFSNESHYFINGQIRKTKNGKRSKSFRK